MTRHRFRPGRARTPTPTTPLGPVSAAAPALLLILLAACGADQPIDQPTPLHGENPIEYPLELWDRGVEGETLLKVRVNDVGAVDSVLLVESSGHPGLDSAAVAGAREMRFTPARKGDKRIRVWARIPVRFSKKPRPSN